MTNTSTAQEVLRMPNSSVLDSLVTGHTRDEVAADIERLRGEARDHAAEAERHLTAAAEAQRAVALLEQVVAYFDGVEIDARTQRAAEEPGRKVNTRQEILAVMREYREAGHDDDLGWTAPAMRTEFERRGLVVTTNLMQVTMRRMTKADQLVRVPSGGFALPSR